VIGEICAVVSVSVALRSDTSDGEWKWNIWLPFGALVNFCEVHLVQGHVFGGSDVH
jgi:hypothetical protein